MLDFVYVTFFKCLCDIAYRLVHMFIFHRKGQVIGVTLVVLTLVTELLYAYGTFLCFM